MTMPRTTVNAITKQEDPITQCAYTFYECMLPVMEGYAYCSRHILQDKNVPFKQCSFVYNFYGRRCLNPAPKSDKKMKTYCADHSRKAQIASIKPTQRHPLSNTSAGMLLLNLNHYMPIDDSYVKNNEDIKVKPLDPFTEIDALKVNADAYDILDYVSSSENEAEQAVANEILKRYKKGLNIPQNHQFKCSECYTSEDIVHILREKLIRLQSLYIDQYKRLHYLLREKRRKYLRALKKEKKTLCSIYDQSRTTVKEKKLYEELKALNRYHKRSGTEAILYKKYLKRRAQTSGGHVQKRPKVFKCIFTEGGVKCSERTLPSAKHCRKHILKDQNQVLFKACGIVRADIECHEPIPVIFDTNCVFHLNLPPQCKLESMKFKTQNSTCQEKPIIDTQSMEIDVFGENEEIDPENDMAGLMKEMNDSVSSKSSFTESIINETSTYALFALLF